MQLPAKAVILARGLGTRMRAEAPESDLTSGQSVAADAGVKALIPLSNGRTMLDLIIENTLAAGFSEICLVIGPEHGIIREFCAAKSLDVDFAIQPQPRGTADAVLAAETWTAGELFLVINSDNLYPVDSLRRLREVGRPGMLAFDREALIAKGNIPAERIAKFATVEIGEDGSLKRVTEKPQTISVDLPVSMNAWLFSSAIFAACRAIGPSERGELEITSAVQFAIDELGETVAVVRTSEAVLDLSSRSDIASVARLLK